MSQSQTAFRSWSDLETRRWFHGRWRSRREGRCTGSQTQSNGCCYGPSAMRARVPYRPPPNIRRTETKGGVAPRKGCIMRALPKGVWSRNSPPASPRDCARPASRRDDTVYARPPMFDRRRSGLRLQNYMGGERPLTAHLRHRGRVRRRTAHHPQATLDARRCYCAAATGEALRSDRRFDPARQLQKGGNDSGAEINAVIDQQGAERFIASPQISVRQIHRVNKINCV